MKDSNLLIPSVAGTSIMTLFSYIISGEEGKNFSEPRLLAALEKDILPKYKKEMALPVGWATHYAIGVLFTSLYQYEIKRFGRKPTLSNGLLFGAVSGLGGILMWKAAFAFHPAPPRTHYTQFYKQLFFAHLVFGATVALMKKEMNG